MNIANELRRVMGLKDADVERLQAELGNCQQVVAKLLDTQKEDAAEIERLKTRFQQFRESELRKCEGAYTHMLNEVARLQKDTERMQKEIERLKEDAERYRFLRDEDNWGCDNDETTESRWGDLGECHGGDFDAFVDKARAALAGKETAHG